MADLYEPDTLQHHEDPHFDDAAMDIDDESQWADKPFAGHRKKWGTVRGLLETGCSSCTDSPLEPPENRRLTVEEILSKSTIKSPSVAPKSPKAAAKSPNVRFGDSAVILSPGMKALSPGVKFIEPEPQQEGPEEGVAQPGLAIAGVRRGRHRKARRTFFFGKILECPRCGSKIRERFNEKHKEKCMPFGQVGSLHLKVSKDLRVIDVIKGGAADEAGIKPNDIIIKVTNPVGECAVATREDFLKAVGPRSEVFKGVTIQVLVIRDPEQIARWKKMRGLSMGDFGSTASMRKQTASIQEGTVELTVTVGEETEAAGENRRKKLEKMRQVFPTMNMSMVDDFMTNPQRCREIIKDAFDKADVDGNGYLDKSEMYEVFKNMAALSGVDPPTQEHATESFTEIDVDGSGSISFDEFFPYLRALFLDVVWGEGTRSKCSRCGLRVRDKLFERHLKVCMGVEFPMGIIDIEVAGAGTLVITEVVPNGLADRSEIRVGDVIKSINGKTVGARIGMARALGPVNQVYAGSKVEMVLISKDKKLKEVEFKMGLLTEDAEEEIVMAIESELDKSYPKLDKTVFFDIVCEFRACKKRIENAFFENDEDGNGYLTHLEVREAFISICRQACLLPPTDSVIDNMFWEVTGDIGSRVSFEEFLPLIRRYFTSIISPTLWARYTLNKDPNALRM